MTADAPGPSRPSSLSPVFRLGHEGDQVLLMRCGPLSRWPTTSFQISAAAFIGSLTFRFWRPVRNAGLGMQWEPDAQSHVQVGGGCRHEGVASSPVIIAYDISDFGQGS